jgi:hypothetical protein
MLHAHFTYKKYLLGLSFFVSVTIRQRLGLFGDRLRAGLGLMLMCWFGDIM